MQRLTARVSRSSSAKSKKVACSLLAPTPTVSRVDPLLHLQTTLGNQAILRALRSTATTKRSLFQKQLEASIGLRKGKRPPLSITPAMLSRQSVEQYETRGMAINPANMNAGIGYWTRKFQSAGFGPPSLEAQLISNEEEQNAVLSTVWQILPNVTFNQQIAKFIEIGPRAGVKSSQDSVYQVLFHPASAQAKPQIEIHLVGRGAGARGRSPSPPTNVAVPADYASHDFSDTEIENIQSTPDPVKNDKLGRLVGLDKLTPQQRAEEGGSVKYTIWQYFAANHTRNAEVDAIIPIADPRGPSRRSVLYTLRFLPTTNDVELERIGEQTRDDEGGARQQGNLKRVNGFSDHTQGAAEPDRVNALVSWLKKRFDKIALPAVTSSTTVADIESNVTKQIHDRSSDPIWFEEMYGIKILAAADAKTKLISLGYKKEGDLTDLKDFEPEHLSFLELALEKISDPILNTFRGVGVARQAIFYKWIKKADFPSGETQFFCDPDPHPVGCFQKLEKVAGTTRGPSSPVITIFDAAWLNLGTLFVGGKDGSGMDVAPAPVEVFTHELGHVVAYAPDLKKKFDDQFGKTKPITWYAESSPDLEFFAEAFALYYSDPEWLKANRRDLFDFFDALNKTGPPAKKKKTRP